MVSVMKEDGCTKVQLTNDKEVYGAGLAQAIEAAAKEHGLDVISNDGDRQERRQLPLAGAEGRGGGRRLLRVLGHHAEQRGPAVQGLRGGASQREALRARRRLRERVRRPHQGRHPGRAWPRASSARRRRCRRPSFRRRASSSSRTTRAKYGDDAPIRTRSTATRRCNLALDAIERSKTGEKADILKALFATKDRSSVLGTYSIDANGDTTLTEMALDGGRGRPADVRSRSSRARRRERRRATASRTSTRRSSCAGRCCATGSCRRRTRRAGAVTA